MIKFINVNKSFNNNLVLNNLNLSFNDNEITLISGKSGKGKTTILNLLCKVYNISKGQILFDGQDISNLNFSKSLKFRRENISLISQDFQLVENISVLSNLKLIIDIKQFNKKEFLKECDEILKICEMEQFKNTLVAKLSGGQKQRVAIIRAILTKNKWIVADEPTSSLDDENTLIVMDLFLKCKQMNKSLIIVTHDARLNKIADRILKL